MTEIGSEQNEINARIVYWGITGAGISSNLAMIHGKLKESNRGALRRVATRIDPTVFYEVLPIELGKVGGVQARMHVIGVPGSAAQAPTRKQLLDRIDGVVFVADSRQECLAANVASLKELVEFLADYGHGPTDIPFVIQYNKCDLVDPFVIERLHREIRIHGAAVYEASATQGTGVLKTLTTISKQVIRHLGRRDENRDATSAPRDAAPVSATRSPDALPSPEIDLTVQPPAMAATPSPAPETRETPKSVLGMMEDAILAEEVDTDEAEAVAAVAKSAQAMLDQPWDAVSHAPKPNNGARIGADLRIVSVGDARRTTERAISVPLVLGNDDGETITLALTIQLDPLLDGEA